jgi:Flp pilus assembly CpaE family ATPase
MTGGFDAPVRLALAIDDSNREERLLRMLQDPSFVAGGRPCEVVTLCASLRDLGDVLAGEVIEAAVVSSQLGAVPFAELTNLAACARRGVRLVVSAPDATDPRWNDFPGGLVVGSQPSAELLALAVAGERSAVGAWRSSEAAEHRLMATEGDSVDTARRDTTRAVQGSARKQRGKLMAIAGAYEPSGRTTVAVGLSRALGARTSVVLVDADTRFGTTPFTLGMSAGHSVCQLAEKHLPSADAWDAALDQELQPMDGSRALVLAGVPRPSMRPHFTPSFYEQLLEVLVERFAFVVMDTSGGGWSTADSGIDGVSLHLADQILLVIRPDVQGVALAREALKHWSGGRKRISLVLADIGNRGQARERRGEIEDVLGLNAVAMVPFDPKGIRDAGRRRRPIVCQRSARAAAPLLGLAGHLVGGGPVVMPPDAEPTAAQRWWRRLPLSAGVGGLVRW